MWRSWEHARMDPANGMSTWLRDHADYLDLSLRTRLQQAALDLTEETA